MRIGKIFIALASTFVIAGCSSSKTMTLSCQEPHIEIYADGEYLGRNLVQYTVPKGKEYIEVSCRENGQEVYSRRYYVKGKGSYVIEIQIPKNYKFSNNPF